MNATLSTWTLAFLALSAGTTIAEDRVTYNRDVRPILSDYCFACHGPDNKQRKAELRLDRREDVIRDRGGYAVVAPVDPEESELLVRVLSDDPDVVMPPPKFNKVLTPAQKETLKQWVKTGAEYEPHWAYVPPKRPVVPVLADTRLVRGPIDAFVQVALPRQALQPAPEADPRTLIRRLSLDLIGLPPTSQEVDVFVRDASAGAYEALVDRLLRSPRFGERMAQGWLDVARYSDTVGFHGDQNQNAWAYRDYVIDAFNTNKPFDQFTLEQLAGDLLPNPTTEQLVATCFNRLNMMTREGGAQPNEYLAKSTADRVRTVGMAWLGTTLNCCECHDHKFDPFTMKDFYSLGAFFADVKQWGVYQDYGYTPNPDLKNFTNDHPFPPEIQVESPALKRRLARLGERVEQLVASSRVDDTAYPKWLMSVRAFLAESPSGWVSPEPTVRIGPAAKNGARPADGPGFLVEDDSRVVFLDKGADPAEIDLTADLDQLAAIRLELLPEAKWDGKVLRAGDSTMIKPAFFLVRENEKPRALAIRHAQADRYAPIYVNGFDVLGVQGGWRIAAEDSRKKHTAVFFLDTPTDLSPGDLVRVSLPNNVIGALRVGLSPLAPEIGRTRFDKPAALLKDEAAARRLHFRSTVREASALAALKAIEREVLECRGGKTPVMITEKTDKPLTIRVLARGNWMDESGEVCKPSTPSFLPTLSGADGRTLDRRDLARWLCSPENPLTARVVMNRLWKQLFGNGLSQQVDDLGAQGDPPSHPELLDWLAVEFREGGWDFKRMAKLIVMSHTYRQQASVCEADPNNRWLASQTPRRLEAEVVRDNALAVAGLLNLDMGGPPSHPYQPAGYYGGLQFPDREYQAELDDRQYRRGVYMHWQRTFLHPMLANFDAPSREDCVAVRTTANSPQQALTLLNDPEFVEAARVWATSLLQREKDDEARWVAAFETALARPPRPAELSGLRAFLDRVRSEYRARPDDAKKVLQVGAAPAPSGDTIELAAWTSVCRVLLNLHETITRY